mgnify:CR=1 FL=1
MSKPQSQYTSQKPNDLADYFQVISDYSAFVDTEEQSLEFPLTISQLASATQTTVHTVRNYVLENLILCHEKTDSGYGLFNQCALNRLRFIRAARAAGLMILDIKPLIYAINDGNEHACSKAIEVLATKVNERRAYLHLLDTQLSELSQLSE